MQTNKMDQSNIENITQHIMSLYIKVCSEDNTAYGKEPRRMYMRKMYDLPITEVDGVKLNMSAGPTPTLDPMGLNTTFIRISPHLIKLVLRIHNLQGASRTIRNYTSGYSYTMNAIPYDTDIEAYLTRFTLLEVREGVKNMVKMISTLSYDVLNGCFTEPRRRRKTKDCPECCVCYEGTKTTLKACKHSVCGRCISNMIGRLTCPMCRALIILKPIKA